MNTSDFVKCDSFPCTDVRHEGYIVPDITVQPERISVILISESAPQDRSDYYYSGLSALYEQTTLLAFQDAGIQASSIQDLLNMGIYFTTAVKCAKTGYGIKARTIETCSYLLEEEISLFSSVKVILLMGDVAIKSLKCIAKRSGEGRVIPAGSTYKIRGGEFTFRGKRVFPSYLQAGPSFFIEKSKRKMIAEDIAYAMQLVV
jgi:uracil-DNA glycosylase